MSRQSVLKRWTETLADVCWPPICPLSEQPVGEAATIHPDVWQEIDFITAPCCQQCGLPFEFQVDGLQRCASCIANPPPYEMARATFIYDDPARKLVTRLKYSDQTHIARMLARWMRQAGKEVLTPEVVLVPVPLHRRRLWQRRYNQSALLVRELSRLTGLPRCMDMLQRVRYTPAQTGLSANQRQRNVQGAFRIKGEQMPEQATIVLVDDVMTTGATLRACSKVLLKAGAKEIRVLTVARTV